MLFFAGAVMDALEKMDDKMSNVYLLVVFMKVHVAALTLSIKHLFALAIKVLIRL